MHAPNGKTDIITETQTLLVKLGFPLGSSGTGGNGIDGKAGEKTRAAIKAFQILAGLAPTGQPDGATLSALGQAAAGGRTFGDLARSAHARGIVITFPPNWDRAEFVNAILGKAHVDEAETGVPAAVTTVQAILESNYGTQTPVDLEDGRNSYNLFGIKGTGPAGSVSCWTREEIEGRIISIIAEFRAYHDYDESIADHSALLAGVRRYRPLFASKDPVQWAYGLQSAGYATDSRYAAKLIAIMREWGIK